MKSGQRRFGTAVFSLLIALLAGCGGGGSGASSTLPAAQVVPPELGTPAPSSDAPVAYFENSGGLTTSGAIVAGAHQALVAVMSGASSAGSFATDTLTVTTPMTAQSAGRVTQSSGRAVAAPHVSRVEAFPADDRELLRGLQTLGLSSGSPAARTIQSVVPQSAAIGTTRSIWVQKGSLSGTRANVQVPATLVGQSAHANIWVDSSLAFTPGEIAQIEADFENAYASDTSHFASADYPPGAPALQPRYSACAPGGAKQGTSAAYISEPADHRIDVMVVNSTNLGGVGGYFSAANLMTQATLNCLNGSNDTYESNEAPFIFVGWFAPSGATYELQEDLVRSTAHELQHLINFVNHDILAAGASSTSFNGNEATYINEGLSMLAQDYAVAAMFGSRGVHFDADDALSRANVYLSDPGNFSLSTFTGIDPGSWGGNGVAQYNCGGGCYGMAYLFERYLSDRFGDKYTRAIETSGTTGDQNLQNVTGETSASLFGDFALAMAANSLQVTTNDSRFHFGSLSLSGTYSDQFGGSVSLGGVFAQPFSGGSMNVSAPVGGFTFVNVGSVPAAGTAVSVSDHATTAGFALEGGLAQK